MIKYCYLIFVIAMLFTNSSWSQSTAVTLSGNIRDARSKTALAFANITLHIVSDSNFISGTITNDKGYFSLAGAKNNTDYFVKVTSAGYQLKVVPVIVGQLSNFLDIGSILLDADEKQLDGIVISGNQEAVSAKMDKKTFNLAENISQAGGSVLEAMRNLPGITTSQDGKVQLRGSDKLIILIDGKQTGLTGFGGQSSLDNIPASAIEKIEIINNPSSKYDANGNAGIINIIYKKEKKDGFNGKIGLAAGAGALWIKKENYPGIRLQYQWTPKFNPGLSLNYQKNKINLFFQGDDLYTKTLNKNEFTERIYDNGDTIFQQLKRNRTTNIVTIKSGVDWSVNSSNTFNFSVLFSSEKILDRGDEPFYNSDFKEQLRLWQFLEDELKTTVTISTGWQHKFRRPGRVLNAGFNYTFHRENEKYFFTNTLPTYVGLDSFKLISDEHVADLNIDYIQPMRFGRFETGLKFRRRYIPTNMEFKPGLNSPLDTSAGGWANYGETIPALYGNYVFESKLIEIEAGVRLEYVHVEYDVNLDHPTYKSSRYNYTQPFPGIRLAYKINNSNRISAFYNRRVDRPNEVDIRIFPKYDDAEIIKVGNPALRPQFTNNFELGYKTNWNNGYFLSSLFHKRMEATITRIASITPGSSLIYNIFQNAGKSRNTGIELMFSQKIKNIVTINLNMTGYKNVIDSFSVVNLYPVENVFTAPKSEIYSGNVKLNAVFNFTKQLEAQVALVYLAPDLVPQGKIYSRFSIDLGIKQTIQKGKAELFLNATDIANTLRIKREIEGEGFKYISTDYYETQVFRIGYNYRF